MKPGRIYYAHFRIGLGMVTVSCERVGDELHCGFAWCNPRDQWCRRLGRKIADGRRGHPACRAIISHPPGALSDGPTPHQACLDGLLAALKFELVRVPRWVHRQTLTWKHRSSNSTFTVRYRFNAEVPLAQPTEQPAEQAEQPR